MADARTNVPIRNPAYEIFKAYKDARGIPLVQGMDEIAEHTRERMNKAKFKRDTTTKHARTQH